MFNRCTRPHTKLAKKMWRFRYIYLMLFFVMAYYAVFAYAPMGGLVIAFQDYKPRKGILNSNWVGFQHFRDFLTSPYAWRVIRNTLLINVYALIFGFPAPVIFALAINEMRDSKYKKAMQTISYLPHFIALVVICGMLREFSMTTGLFNDIRSLLGMERTNFLSRPEYFRTVYIASNIWQNIGWGSIIYLATLTNTDHSLHEAAAIDGANRIQRLIHINFPVLVPIIAVQLIMRIGNIMSQGHEKVILLYSAATYETADIVSSYVYRRGLLQNEYSYGAAVGLFNSVVNLIMLVSCNTLSKRVSENSLW